MLIAAALIIAAAAYLMVRRVDIRLVLLGAGLAMAMLAGRPLAIADTFTRGMVTAMVAPICASMGSPRSCMPPDAIATWCTRCWRRCAGPSGWRSPAASWPPIS
jgi:hypothetical protein